MRRSKMMMATTALILSTALGACGGGEDEADAPAGDASSEATSESPSPSESTSESESPSESVPEGATGSSGYCQELKAAEQQFDSLAQGDVAQLDRAISTLRDLSAAAPAEVSGAWRDLLEPIDQLEAALNGAGLELGDLEGLSQGQVPQGVDAQGLQALATELQGLGSAKAEQAGVAIEEHAVSECGITLGQ